jgi:hypothetical protein
MSATSQRWRTWNQKIHIYVGLYFLVFIWLFSVSGLLLNHHWSFAEFWPQRRQAKLERTIVPPTASTDLERARDLMRQLGLAGEIESTTTRASQERFDFRVARPGFNAEVSADLAHRTATAQETRVNGWGVFRTLHTFTGVRLSAPTAERDWWLTKLWSFSMDAVCVGVAVLILTSLALAYERREHRLGSTVALAAGMLACGYFVFGLNWL